MDAHDPLGHDAIKARRDPVCGMTPSPETPHRLTHNREEVLFCSASCKAKFEADPLNYVGQHGEAHHKHAPHGSAPVDPATVPAGAKWTCAMHPQIVRDGPGSCPICGMALEPATPSADVGDNPELIDMTRRLWVAAILSAPVLWLEMGAHLGLVPMVLHGSIGQWLQLLLATPVVLWAGWPFFERGWGSVVNRSLNMFTLIAMGVGVAYGYSVIATLLPGVVPAGFRQNGAVPVYFEPAAIITTLVLVGQVLELRARSRPSQAIKALLKLTPETARRVRADGAEEDVPLDAVNVGDLLRVRPGERAPVDGMVME